MKKLLAIVLCLLLLFSAVPLGVFAYESNSNLETVQGSFELLGRGFNALGNEEIRDSEIAPRASIFNDNVQSTLLGTSYTTANSRYAKSVQELMSSFGIEFGNDTNVSVPVYAAKVSFENKFSASSSVTNKSVTESIYYYYYQQTITNRFALQKDSLDGQLSADFLAALDELNKDYSPAKLAEFFETWGTHVLTSYDKGGFLEYTASAHSTSTKCTENTKVSEEIGASVGVGNASVGTSFKVSQTLQEEFGTEDYVLNHSWTAYGGDSNYVGPKETDDEQSVVIDAADWKKSISHENAVLLPQSTQWKAIWEFIPEGEEYANVIAALQTYYSEQATGINAAFFAKYTTYFDVTAATEVYYVSPTKDPAGNNLVYKMAVSGEYIVDPASKINVVNVGTDLSNMYIDVSPAGHAWVDADGYVTFSDTLNDGEVVTVKIREYAPDGTPSDKVRAQGTYKIQREGVKSGNRLFEGGYGDATRPYLIATATQLSNIRSANVAGTHFRLIRDINVGNFEPLPNFVATFDGNNYTLSGGRYTLSTSGSFGLFKEIVAGATVKNVILKDFYINSTNKGNITDMVFVGLLCGKNAGTIENVQIDYGRIDTQMGGLDKNGNKWLEVGLLCGNSSGTVARCGVSSTSGKSFVKAVCEVGVGGYGESDWGETLVGGLIGYAHLGTVRDVYVYDCTVIGVAHSTTKIITIGLWPWKKEVCDNHGRPALHAGGICGSIKDVTLERAVCYDNNLSGSYCALDKCICNEPIIEDIGAVIGEVRAPTSGYTTVVTDVYGESGEGDLIGDNEIGTTGAKAMSSLKAAGIISNLNGFAAEWYQPGNAGHITIAQPASLAINSAYLDTEYFVGEPLRLIGLEVKQVEEGSVSPLDALVNGFTVTGYDPSMVGEQTITVAYGKVTGTYTVVVKEPVVTSLSVVNLPDQTLFYEGEEIDYTGLSVMAVKDDGSTVNVAISDLEFSVVEAENDSKTVIVTYAGCTAEFMIQICPVVATGIEIVTLADKTAFAVGEDFSASGLTLELLFNNGTKQPLSIEDVAVVVPDMSSYGPKTVTVTYGEFVCTYEIVIEGCAHKETVHVPAVASTCASEGCGEYVMCTYCETVLSGSKAPLPKLEHTYNNACDADCNICGEVRVPATHVYDNACDADCNVCGYVRQVGDHVYIGKVTIDPTCTDDGVKTYTCYVCNDSYIELVSAVGHDYHGVVTPPTCEREGYTTYTCSACGNSYVSDYTPHTGHSVAIISGYAPTCESQGLTDGEQCSACGVTLKPQQPIPAPGHVYDDEYDATCNNCGFIRDALCKHEYRATVTAPDCYNGGYTTYTCVKCNDVYVADVVDALGHNYHAVVTAPNCVSGGYTTHTCSACGNSYVSDYTDALGHVSVALPGYAATCEADGLTDGEQCSACDALLVAQTVIPALDHTYDNACDADCNVCFAVREVSAHAYLGSVTTAATCGSAGVRTYVCSVCGDSYTEAIPATGDHTYDNDFDADCNVCGAVREGLDENAPAFVVDDVTTSAGQTFTVAIRTQRNSGIVSLKLNLIYDTDVLTLMEVEEKDFSGMSFSPITNTPFVINWVDAIHPDNTTDGVVVLLTFCVKEGVASGTTDISLSYDADDIYNQSFDNVAFRVESGTVKIIDYLPGDVNNDGKVNNKDLGLLQQYLNGWGVSVNKAGADVTGDGKVNNKDLGLLQQYLNGWKVELG